MATFENANRSGRDRIYPRYQNVPRQIRNMPVVEYLFGSQAADLYDAIFEVEDSRDFNLFNEIDNEEPSGLSPMAPSTAPAGSSPSGQPSLLVEDWRSRSPSRNRKISALTPLEEISSTAEVLSLETTTPFTRLFSRRPTVPSLRVDNLGAAQLDSEGGLQRLQSLLEECRELPVTRIRDEMKELQVSLLLCALKVVSMV